MTARRVFTVTAVMAVVVVAAQPLELAGRYGALAGAAPSTITAGLLWWAIGVHRPTNPAPWRWIAAFMTATAIGDHIVVADTWLFQRESPVVGLPDVFYLAGLVMLIVGLAGMLRANTGRRRDLDTTLDALTAASVAFFLALLFVIGPALRSSASPLIERLVNVTYPVIDVSLLALLVSLRRNRSRSGVLLWWALGFWLASDTVFFVLSQYAAPGPISLTALDTSWAAGTMLFGLAAWHSSMRQLTAPSSLLPPPAISHGRLIVAIGVFFIPVATEAINEWITHRPTNQVPVLLTTAALAGLVIVRVLHLARRREAAEAAIAGRERYYRALAKHSADVTICLLPDGRVSDVVGSLVELLGYGTPTPTTSILELVFADDHDQIVSLLDRSESAPGALLETECRMRHASRPFVWVGVRLLNSCADPDVGGFVVSLSDIADRAFHDPLTQLANRPLFRDRLDHALAHNARVAAPVAILFMDLDGFKTVNDSLGHDIGDLLLRGVADRLTQAVRSGDTVARFGGDEFAVLVEDGYDARLDAEELAARIQNFLHEPIEVGDQTIVARVSIGVAVSDGSDDAAALLRNADIAMYQAKAGGKGGVAIYEHAMHAAPAERLRLENDLFGALERDELRVLYQPVVSLATGEVHGFEALVRWEHPTLGVLAPPRFLPIAEDNGFIVALDAWVLETACRTVKSWQDRFAGVPLTIAVNLSGHDLADAEISTRVASVIDRTGIDPATLVLEVTESVLMHDPAAAAARIDALRALGVSFAIDDFGTGYSSLGYLRQFQLDILKIDRSFVTTIRDGAAMPAILRTVIDLADALQLDIVAEGIEHPYQHELLRDACLYGQGYLFAMPLSASDAERYLHTQRPAFAASGGSRAATGPAPPARSSLTMDVHRLRSDDDLGRPDDVAPVPAANG